MMYDGKLVLDAKSNPMLKYDILQDTISSDEEGWRLEAYMRLNIATSYDDIVAGRWAVTVTTLEAMNWAFV